MIRQASSLPTLLLAASLAASGASAQAPESPVALIAADPKAAALYVYAVPALDIVARFDGVAVDGHAGSIVLSGGQVLLIDGKAQELLVLDLSGAQPRLAQRIAIPSSGADGFAWSAVDPTGRYYAATSYSEEASFETLSLVDLGTASVNQVKVDKGGGEVGVVIGGEPAAVILHLADRAETYPLAALQAAGPDDLLNGSLRPTSSVPVGPGGHGNSFVPAAGLWVGSTEAGLELARLADGSLGAPTIVAWDAGGRVGGQNYRQRLTADGSTIFGPLLAAPEPAQWAEGQVDLHWVDLEAGTALRTPLATGIVSRGGISVGLAAYASIEAAGDRLLLVDIDPASPNFRATFAAIALEKLSHGPVSGQDPAGTQRRHAAISPDGQWAFVSHGGDGRISVVDTIERTVVGTIETPTPLDGGGYILAVQPGAGFWEAAGR